jgi:hypothetical protein
VRPDLLRPRPSAAIQGTGWRLLICAVIITNLPISTGERGERFDQMITIILLVAEQLVLIN